MNNGDDDGLAELVVAVTVKQPTGGAPTSRTFISEKSERSEKSLPSLEALSLSSLYSQPQGEGT
jgi:hypothetical protein